VVYFGNGRTGWKDSVVAGNGWGNFTAIF